MRARVVRPSSDRTVLFEVRFARGDEFKGPAAVVASAGRQLLLHYRDVPGLVSADEDLGGLRADVFSDGEGLRSGPRRDTE